jgi:hypothetical protein
MAKRLRVPVKALFEFPERRPSKVAARLVVGVGEYLKGEIE